MSFTGAGGQAASERRYPDGTRLYLNNEAIVHLRAQARENNAVVNQLKNAVVNQLKLEKDSLVVETEATAFVSNPCGAKAEITNGLLGVDYDPDTFRLSAVCLHGEECRLAGDLEGEVSLTTRQSSEAGGNGGPSAPVSYAFVAAVVPAPTTTLTLTHTPTAL